MKPNSIFNGLHSSNKAKKAAAIFSLLFIAVIFQNFDYVNSLKVNLIPINEKARTSHAKELLGKKYNGSAAQTVERATTLGFAIFEDVYKNLPKKFKADAVAVASTIIQESEKYETDPVFVMAVIKTESSFNPVARGGHGEIGLMQLKPDTAEWIAKKYKIKWHGKKSLENPVTNVILGMAYFDYLRERFDGHPTKYVAAYNMGAASVCRMYASEQTPRGYATRVMKNYNSTYKKLAAATTLSLLAGN